MRTDPSRTKDEKLATSTEHSPFILGSPIPNPSKLSDEKFTQAVSNIFYNLISIQNEHLYAETSEKIMARLFDCNLRKLSPEDLGNLEAWFCDPRFMDILILLQVRQVDTLELMSLSDRVSEPYKAYKASEQGASALFRDISGAHGQIWGSFVGFPNSILNLLIGMQNEKREPNERLQQLREVREKVDSHEIGLLYTSLLPKKKKVTLTDVQIREEVKRAEVRLNQLLKRSVTRTQVQSAEKRLMDFFHRRINDIHLKTVDCCFTLTERKKDYEKEQGANFSDVGLIYNVLFNIHYRGFLRNVRVKDIDSWLNAFFHELLLTLDDLRERPKRDSGEGLLQKLDSRFRGSEEELIKALNSLSENELEIFKNTHSALISIIMNASPGSPISALSDTKRCAKLLANIFSDPLKKLLALKEEPPVKPQPKKSNTSLSGWDVFWIVAGVIFITAAVVLLAYLAVQTLGLAPIILGGATAVGITAGGLTAGGILSTFIGFRKKIESFFNSLFDKPNNKKTTPIARNPVPPQTKKRQDVSPPHPDVVAKSKAGSTRTRSFQLRPPMPPTTIKEPSTASFKGLNAEERIGREFLNKHCPTQKKSHRIGKAAVSVVTQCLDARGLCSEVAEADSEPPPITHKGSTDQFVLKFPSKGQEQQQVSTAEARRTNSFKLLEDQEGVDQERDAQSVGAMIQHGSGVFTGLDDAERLQQGVVDKQASQADEGRTVDVSCS